MVGIVAAHADDGYDPQPRDHDAERYPNPIVGWGETRGHRTPKRRTDPEIPVASVGHFGGHENLPIGSWRQIVRGRVDPDSTDRGRPKRCLLYGVRCRGTDRQTVDVRVGRVRIHGCYDVRYTDFVCHGDGGTGHGVDPDRTVDPRGWIH